MNDNELTRDTANRMTYPGSFGTEHGSTVFTLRVDRLLGAESIPGRSVVQVDPLLMERENLRAGDLLRLSNERGEAQLARLGPPHTADAGSALIRMDRYLRVALRARLGSPMRAERVVPPMALKVFLQPSLDLLDDHHLTDRLRDEMVRQHVPVSDGAFLYLPINEAGIAAIFKVSRVDDEPGVVGAATRVFLDQPDPADPTAHTDVTLDDVGGLGREIQAIRELVDLPLTRPAIYRRLGIQPPRGVILHGPPGTGKTHVCRALATELDASFYYVNGPEVIGTMHGETEATLRNLFGEASHHAPSIICIDELDALARWRRDLGSQTDLRAATQLLVLLDGLRRIDGVVVVGTTNQLDVIDAAFRRPGRFDREIYIGPPDAVGRLEILRIHTRDMPLSGDAQAILDKIAAETPGFVGADLLDLCREAGLESLRRAAAKRTPQSISNTALMAVEVTAADLQSARARQRPSAARHDLVQPVPKAAPRLLGLERQWHELRSIAEQRFVAEGPETSVVPVTGGVLLEGPPGCGKSALVNRLAVEFQPSFVVVQGPELFSQWLGNTERAVRHVFDLAERMAPTLLFFDQLEAIAPERGEDTGSRTTDRVVAQLLTELDKLDTWSRVLVVGASDRPELIDQAILRAGRLGTRLSVKLPDLEQRTALVRHFAGELNVPVGEEEGTWISAHTEGFSPADLRALFTRIGLATRESHGGRVSSEVVRQIVAEAGIIRRPTH